MQEYVDEYDYYKIVTYSRVEYDVVVVSKIRAMFGIIGTIGFQAYA